MYYILYYAVIHVLHVYVRVLYKILYYAVLDDLMLLFRMAVPGGIFKNENKTATQPTHIRHNFNCTDDMNVSGFIHTKSIYAVLFFYINICQIMYLLETTRRNTKRKLNSNVKQVCELA